MSSFFKRDTKLQQFFLDMMIAGWVLMPVGWFFGTSAQKTQLLFCELILYAPTIFYGFFKIRRIGHVSKKELRQQEIKSIVMETLLEIMDPAEYQRLKKAGLIGSSKK